MHDRPRPKTGMLPPREQREAEKLAARRLAASALADPSADGCVVVATTARGRVLQIRLYGTCDVAAPETWEGMPVEVLRGCAKPKTLPAFPG